MKGGVTGIERGQLIKSANVLKIIRLARIKKMHIPVQQKIEE